eukprot:6490398-Amphidinium_carterae.1
MSAPQLDGSAAAVSLRCTLSVEKCCEVHVGGGIRVLKSELESELKSGSESDRAWKLVVCS